MENTTFGMTFNSLLKNKEFSTNNSLLSEIREQLRLASRSYVTDCTDPSTEGHYLQDFLLAHGNEPIRPIYFCDGSPHMRGEGIKFIDVDKIRRQLEDSLRKGDTDKLFEVARKCNLGIDYENAIIY